MIAKAWMDETFRATLSAEGIQVPPRPEDLEDCQIDGGDRERHDYTPAS
ncbi:hypothetical protein WME88_54085 [Sorangium sp. So ce216]